MRALGVLLAVVTIFAAAMLISAEIQHREVEARVFGQNF